MKALVYENFGNVDQLHFEEFPTPTPADHEVLIEINYAAVNPVDWKIREGLLKGLLPHDFPIVPGWDAAGKIAAIGKNVSKFKVGDEVYAYCRKPIVKWGTYSEYICFDEALVALKPKNITFAQAAAIPLVGLTAWQALFDFAKLKKGDTILIHAGAGGVGSLAIEFAKQAGASKIITTASEENHPYVKKLGADFPIDYRKENFISRVHAIAPEGVDIVLDCVGGQTLRDSYQIVKPGGRLVSIVQQVDSSLASKHNITGGFVFVAPNGKQLSQISALIEKGKVVAPHIEEMPLSSAAAAQEKVKKGHTQGKIVLKVK